MSLHLKTWQRCAPHAIKPSRRRTHNLSLVSSQFAAVLLILCAPAFGQTFTTLHTFTGLDGSTPVGQLIQGQDGFLYGTTSDGGAYGAGTIYKMAPDGSGFTTLYSLHQRSYSGLSQGSDGALYGTTLFGGGAGFNGSVYKARPDGASIVDLYFFPLVNNSFGPDGNNPISAPVVGGDGYVYGVAPQGGTIFNPPFGGGVVYKLATDGSTFQVLHAFTGGDGAQPFGALILGNDGLLYGTTAGGGVNGAGAVSRIGRDGAAFQTLYDFGNEANLPFAGLMQGSDGLMYGTTINGNPDLGGTLFKLGTDGTGFSVLAGFDYRPDLFFFLGGQQVPHSTVVEGQDGNLYGSSLTGGTNGTLYRVARDGSGLTTLYSFSPLSPPSTTPNSSNTNSDGAYPLATMIASDGNLYGTTSYGGANGQGTIFKYSIFTYSWSNYLQPINTDGSSIFKLGRTVPVKFQFTGASAGISNVVARLYIAKVSNNVIGTYLEASSTSAADSGNQFRYDAAGGQYIFNLGTNGLTTGTYELKVDLGDGDQNRTALISLK